MALLWFAVQSASVAQEKQPEKGRKSRTRRPNWPSSSTTRRLHDPDRDKPEVVLKLHESPVLNFTNPERNQELGSVFVWLDDNGRPAVLGQFFKHDARNGRVKKHALHSLAAVELEAKFRDKIAWTPEQPGVEWKSFPNAPRGRGDAGGAAPSDEGNSRGRSR